MSKPKETQGETCPFESPRRLGIWSKGSERGEGTGGRRVKGGRRRERREGGRGKDREKRKREGRKKHGEEERNEAKGWR